MQCKAKNNRGVFAITCRFCEKIYDFEEYISENLDYISFDSECKKFWLHANSGDKYCQGLLYDVKYCPYCGKDLRSVLYGKD